MNKLTSGQKLAVSLAAAAGFGIVGIWLPICLLGTAYFGYNAFLIIKEDFLEIDD